MQYWLFSQKNSSLASFSMMSYRYQSLIHTFSTCFQSNHRRAQDVRLVSLCVCTIRISCWGASTLLGFQPHLGGYQHPTHTLFSKNTCMQKQKNWVPFGSYVPGMPPGSANDELKCQRFYNVKVQIV